MTGRHPNRMGVFKWGYPIRPQELTIAEVLRDAGYVTGHFGKWHLGSVRTASPVHPGHNGFDEWLSAPNFFDNDPILSHLGKAVQLNGESSTGHRRCRPGVDLGCRHSRPTVLRSRLVRLSPRSASGCR